MDVALGGDVLLVLGSVRGPVRPWLSVFFGCDLTNRDQAVTETRGTWEVRKVGDGVTRASCHVHSLQGNVFQCVIVDMFQRTKYTRHRRQKGSVGKGTLSFIARVLDNILMLHVIGWVVWVTTSLFNVCE